MEVKRTETRLRATRPEVNPILPPPTTSSSSDRLLKRKEVAARLGCCIHTVMRLTSSGALACVRVNSRFIRYRESDVASFLSANS